MLWFIYVLIYVLVVAGWWMIFQKAGEAGWKSIIPIWNILVLLRIVGREWWWIILMLIPLVHNRAVRLTMKRLEAATPVSMTEIQAEKDQLRAEFAMSTRRLEMSVDQLKARTTSQLAEIGKKTDAINRLKAELTDKTSAVFTMEAREKSLRDQLQATETEHGSKLAALDEAERTLADKKAELAKLTNDLDERSVHADRQRIEMVALRTQVEALKQKVIDREKDAKEIGERLDRERGDAKIAAAELVDERAKADKLHERVGELERALVVQTTEAEIQARRVQELETRHSEQMRILTQHEIECRQLRDKLAAADKTEVELRGQLALIEQRHHAATEGLKNEKIAADNELAKASAAMTKTQDDMAGMKRDAELHERLGNLGRDPHQDHRRAKQARLGGGAQEPIGDAGVDHRHAADVDDHGARVGGADRGEQQIGDPLGAQRHDRPN